METDQGRVIIFWQIYIQIDLGFHSSDFQGLI